MDNKLVKICTNCKTEYPLSMFHKHNKSKDGVRSECKLCRKKEFKLLYESNKKDILEKNKLSYYKNKNNVKARLQKRKDEIKFKAKLYRLKNKDKIYQKIKLWRLRNPEKITMYRFTRRDKKNKLDTKLQFNFVSFVEERFNFKCFNCDSTEKLEIDHNFPLIKGNGLSLDNSVLLCKSCNCSKGKKEPSDFYSPEKLWQLSFILKGSYVFC